MGIGKRAHGQGNKGKKDKLGVGEGGYIHEKEKGRQTREYLNRPRYPWPLTGIQLQIVEMKQT